ncbi:pyridoxamine 5'-phosphate oxidase [Capsulimonas corticalis]|uniref:Pyridoxamine 5'-phosphate oxidase n=1 Tax=Capsulimonas corticalis TaxID=2219043 RepID=A0A402CQR0_9BACT|nr:pyridoxamine 5'-phosphate oxidase family protein [Capsulimonas corticalis]BDI34394.1 pyridoxamine 5'-phosphate oxidase [Capsulimonas corticalis]
MSKQIDSIDEELSEWLRRQHVFFVATAPLCADGHINCSPKGGDSFRVLGPLEVAYQDYTGSGAETAAHLRENGRILLMFCGFEGKPNIARLHGQGEVIAPDHADYESLDALFPVNPGTRCYVRVQVERVSTSCGFSVPFMDFRSDRDTLDKFAASKGPAGLAEYRAQKNAVSIDGMPALPMPAMNDSN